MAMALDQSDAAQGRMSRRSHTGSARSSGSRVLPFHTAHTIGRFLRLLSVYVVFQYLTLPGTSVIIFMFLCLLLASIAFIILQPPWKGRPLSTSQLVGTLINGLVLAISFVLWGEGLRKCGPVRTVMAEYVGAVLGALSTLAFGRAGRKWKKVIGLLAMVSSYFLFSQGWAMSTYSPLSFKKNTIAGSVSYDEGSVGFSSMSLSFSAGILAALHRVIGRRLSLKTQIKRRLHVVTIIAATCFLFPLAILQTTKISDSVGQDLRPLSSWAIACNTLFGILALFYVDLLAEERLHISVSSPQHLFVTCGCLVILEAFYKMDFSPFGFATCATLLGLGIFESTSSEKIRRTSMELPTQIDDFTSDTLIMQPVINSGPNSSTSW